MLRNGKEFVVMTIVGTKGRVTEKRAEESSNKGLKTHIKVL